MEKTSKIFDVVIVGSGPSGVQAAAVLVKKGLNVALFDVGNRDDKYAPKIPHQDFQTIRETDPSQRFYFLGENAMERVLSSQNSAAPHLTPPRSHMVQDAEKLFPISACEEVVSILQSSGYGGLGISWGANCFEFESHELERVGLPSAEIQGIYSDLSKDIGVSGKSDSDIAPFVSAVGQLQAPLELDGNGAQILAQYEKKKAAHHQAGFFLGPSVLAMLTEPLGSRAATNYHDMDFWSDQGQSVYRPRYTLEALMEYPGFSYFPGHLCVSLKSVEGSQVQVSFRDLLAEKAVDVQTRRVVLAAGALNSGKIVLNSKKDFRGSLPLLCNRNHWIAGMNLRTLGKKMKNRRHSLSQLTAVMKRPGGSLDYLVGHFYSYRSLLLYRLVKELPFDPFISLSLLRLILSSLTVVNLHFSDAGEDVTRLRLIERGLFNHLEVQHTSNIEKQRDDLQAERLFLAQLLKLWILPLKVRRPPRGSSIHYAGTLPMSPVWGQNQVKQSGELWELPGVFVADSSSWKFLPAKGLTYTLMANARRVAGQVAESLLL